MSLQQVAAIVEEPEGSARTVAAVLRAGPGRPKKEEHNDVQEHHIRPGTGKRAYTLARLRRDDPETAERVERGELSANAAAVAKGWAD